VAALFEAASRCHRRDRVERLWRSGGGNAWRHPYRQRLVVTLEIVAILSTINPLSFARERLTQPLRESGIGRHFDGGLGQALFIDLLSLCSFRALASWRIGASRVTLH
jgi:hypothetical protein